MEGSLRSTCQVQIQRGFGGGQNSSAEQIMFKVSCSWSRTVYVFCLVVLFYFSVPDMSVVQSRMCV